MLGLLAAEKLWKFISRDARSYLSTSTLKTELRVPYGKINYAKVCLIE